MLPAMTRQATPPFESLHAARARNRWGISVATQRPSMDALYEFGGG